MPINAIVNSVDSMKLVLQLVSDLREAVYCLHNVVNPQD